MATYAELYTLANAGGAGTEALLRKIHVALTVKAGSYLAGTPTATQIGWASACLANPDQYALAVLRALLAQNRALTTAQISGVTDEGLQTAVDNLIDKFYVG
jgi:hypothetical protein